MKFQLKTYYYLIVLIFICNTSIAQNNGYAGKRFLFKTDVIHGVKAAFTGVTVEMVPLRHTTFSIGYHLYSTSINQKFNGGEYLEYYYDEGPEKIPDKANVKTKSINLELRQYVSGGVVTPAPAGFFGYLSTSFGKVDIEGNYYESLFISDLTDNKGQYLTYSFENLDFHSVELGFGYQSFITQWLTLGFKFGFDYTKVKSPDGSGQEKLLSGAVRNYGYNLVGGRLSLRALSYYEEIDPATNSKGFSFYLQAGIIFF